jgi:C-terminal processing protease CtpA/Prc
MVRRWSLLLWLAYTSTGFAQTLTRQNLANILGFENGSPGTFPAGWSGGPTDTIIVTDDHIVHSGKYSARIERNGSSSGTFSTLTASIPLDFDGKRIEWRGYLKTENVNGFVALWLREDSDTSVLAFDTIQGLNLGGTRDWALYSVTIYPVPTGTRLVFGFLLAGTGKAWVDDLELLADSNPVGLAPPRTSTVFDNDHEFDAGSRINISGLSSVQIKNLATLAKVWGFVKYHHPAVTGGLHHWDYELFRILPRVLEAADGVAANTAISSWIAGLGRVEDCTDCAILNSDDLYLSPNLDWIADESLLGADLSRTLRNIHRNRKPAVKQFYVSLAPGVGNPVFNNELSYGSIKLPDSGYQLLGLFRFWNMVQYFYPNRDIMADDPADSPDYWDKVLEESIPGIALSQDSLTYQQELMKFIAKIHDTHSNLWSSLAARPPIGSCQLPVDVRFVEGRPMVLRHISATAGPASGLLPGDLIEQLDGVPIDDLINQWRPLYADSNEAARLRDIGRYLTRGPCGSAAVAVRRGETSLNLTSNRVAISSLDFSASYTHDLPGDTFQKVSDQIAYLKLSSVQAAESADYIRAAAGTKGLIIDIRNYPSEFVVFTLGQLLVSGLTDFVRFTNGDVTNPGAFHWGQSVRLTPQQPHYSGRVAILVDEVTQSQAEYTTMAFRTAPIATVIGSTTAGADGDVSTVPLPGGFSSYISGIGVFYPDKQPTQRVGIIPDIEVKPTIEGIRAGRDELIERAIQVLSPESALEVSLPAGGSGVASTVGSGGPVQTGYAVAAVTSGSAPYGVAVFSFRNKGVVVSEAAVPVSPPTTSARILVDYRSGIAAMPGHADAGFSSINTGLALVNHGDAVANVTYTLRDKSGTVLTTGHGTVAVGSHFAKLISLLNDVAPDFNIPGDFPTAIQFGSLDITSDQPLSFTTLRITMNRRNETLLTALPIVDLTRPPGSVPLYYPHFVDGGGYSPSVFLLNTSTALETGRLVFSGEDGAPLVVKAADGTVGSLLAYSIPPGGVFVVQTAGSPANTSIGWIQVTPDANSPSPAGMGLFSFSQGGTLVSESGIPAATPTTHARIYIDQTGNHGTGLALASPGNTENPVTLRAYGTDGSTPVGNSVVLTLKPGGHAARFVSQLIPELPRNFTGILDISSPVPFVALTVRSLTNSRGDFLMTTFPVADMIQPAPAPVVFPQIADGGGYMTEFILLSASEPASMTLKFYGEDGKSLAVGNRGAAKF